MKIVKELIVLFLASVVSSVISRRLFDKETQFWPYELTFFGITGAIYVTYLYLARERKEA